jgi:NarL family two-component system response regulator LiaR
MQRGAVPSILLWALVLAAAAFGLEWLRYEYMARLFSREIYVSIIAIAFAAGGVWLGWKLTARPGPASFQRNTAAVASLGLTRQELRVLERLAAGQSTKEIARTLGLSPNTVKTHTANLFAKLEVGRRTAAVGKARELSLIP